MEKITLKKKTDYYGVHYGEIYGEIDLVEAEQIKNLIKTIKSILENSACCNTFQGKI